MTRKNRRIWALIIGIVILAIPFLFGSHGAETSEISGIVDYKYTINSLNLDCNVLNNGSADITYDVSITMNENKDMKEMLVSIPYYGKLYSSEDGKLTIREYSAKVSNFKLIESSEKVFINQYNDSNDPDCPTGCVMVGLEKANGFFESEQTYTLKFSYNYRMKNQKVNTLDELYLNLIGTNSSMPINNIGFSIAFPKDIDFTTFKPSVYYGKVGSANKYEDLIITSSSISSGSPINLNPYESLTIRQFAPEGYFVYEQISRAPIIWAIVLTILGVVAILVIKIVTRQSKEVLTPVELVAPNDILPNEAEFLVKHKTTNRVFAASIVWLASHGYIKIEETETETYLIKTKEPDASLDANLQSVLNSLKGDGEKTDIKELSTIETSIMVSKMRKSPESKYDKEIFNKHCLWWAYFVDIIMIALMIVNVVLLYKQVEVEVGFLSATSIPLRWFIGGKIIFALNIILLATWFIFFKPKYNQATEKGKEFIKKRGRMLGLKKYITMVEEPQLKMFAKENPSLFYDILPYAYVFGVSNIWIDKFKTIEIMESEWYSGSTIGTYFWFKSFSTRSRSVISTADFKAFSSRMASDSSFGGSSGGGSFGGGGGFSGGGGGGASFGGR